MELGLGRRSDYAIRATLCLARWHGDRLVPSREVAQRMDIPPRFLYQIMAALVRAGIVASTPGRSGGYALAADPVSVSVLDVVEAVEGEIRASVCLLRGGPCHWQGACAMHEQWTAAQQALLDDLARIDLASVAARDAGLEAAARLTAAAESQAGTSGSE